VPDGDKMRWPLTVSYDMGWQKRASGVQYNSSSGHGFLVGAHSNRILGHVCYSKNCAKCSREWKKQECTRDEATKDELAGELPNNKDTHRCPRNFSGSSKSMEACGAIKLVTEIFDLYDAYVSIIIGDDDSTTRSNLKHSFKELILSGKWANKEQWPKTKGGKLVDDKGKLPLRV